MRDQIKKLNRGVAVLFVIIVIAVIYNVAVFLEQKSDTPKIKETCQEYLDTRAKYSLLPEEFQTGEAVISDTAYSEYLSEADDAVLAYYIDDDTYQDFAKTELDTILSTQKDGDSYILLDLSYEILSYDSINFYNDLATVTFTAKITGSYLQNEYGVWNDASISENASCTITFAPDGGDWKIEYANIYLPSVNASDNDTDSQYMMNYTY